MAAKIKPLEEYTIDKLALTKMKANDKQSWWWPVKVKAYDTESMMLVVKYLFKRSKPT